LQARWVRVGSNFLNPWRYGVEKWKQPTVIVGDELIFRWFGFRNLRQFQDPVSYTACNFNLALNLHPTQFVGFFRYPVPSSDRYTTLYFASNNNDDCQRGIKAKITIS
ncbi:hypothetical protein CLOP_g3788, partial [Closterium sp. NIES-67]